jgi:ornithine cyclodeaminase/alanine dehydrogenase-like protein (mu-crystallin family)
LRVITEADVARVLTYEALIPAMEQALAALSAGTVIQPVRHMLAVEEAKRYLAVMPAVTGAAMGAKLVSIYPGNEGTRWPTHSAAILLLDPEHGEPLAVVEGRLITEMRTAALSAAVTRHLAPPEPKVLALIGSGVQASAHLEALRTLHDFTHVRVASRTRANAAKFAAEHGAVATDIETAVLGADIVVTATSSKDPVVRGAWLKPGAHVNAVGSSRPAWRELDDAAMRNVVVVDSRDAALKEAGDVVQSNAEIFAEAGEIFAGTRVADRNATTIFKSVGLAVEDIATARLVYDAVVEGN